MPQIGDYEVWIEVDEVRLPEFRVVVDETTQSVKCWVPSEVGKNFIIHWKTHSKLHDSELDLWLDGQKSNHASVLRGRGGQRKREGTYTSPDTISLFKFAPVVLTADESAIENEADAERLGTIKVKIQEGSVSAHQVPFVGRPPPTLKPVHEATKKTIGHRVQCVGERRLSTGWSTFVPSETRPFYFLFEYRPKEILQADGIIPAPDPVTSTSPPTAGNTSVPNNPSSQLDADQIEAFQSQIRNLESQLNALRELSAVKNEDEPFRRVKFEEIEPGRFFSKGEVIDLT